MKTFRLVIEFENTPDDFPMEAAKQMASKAVFDIPAQDAEDDTDYVYKITDVHRGSVQ